MYPGLGFGLIAATAKVLNGETLSAACHALGGLVDASQPGAAVLPPVDQLTTFSQKLAEIVAQSVLDQGLNKEPISDAKQAVAAMKWTPFTLKITNFRNPHNRNCPIQRAVVKKIDLELRSIFLVHAIEKATHYLSQQEFAVTGQVRPSGYREITRQLSVTRGDRCQLCRWAKLSGFLSLAHGTTFGTAFQAQS